MFIPNTSLLYAAFAAGNSFTATLLVKMSLFASYTAALVAVIMITLSVITLIKANA